MNFKFVLAFSCLIAVSSAFIIQNTTPSTTTTQVPCLTGADQQLARQRLQRTLTQLRINQNVDYRLQSINQVCGDPSRFVYDVNLFDADLMVNKQCAVIITNGPNGRATFRCVQVN